MSIVPIEKVFVSKTKIKHFKVFQVYFWFCSRISENRLHSTMGFHPGQEIISKERPFSHIINNKFRSTYCDWCIQKRDPNSKLQKCSACKEVYYCNRYCQKEAFKSYHKEECARLKILAVEFVRDPSDNSAKINDLLIFMGRTIIKAKNGGDQIVVKLPDETERRFCDLVSHDKEILQSGTKLISLFKDEKGSSIQQLLGDVSFEYLLMIYGKLSINQHAIMSPSLEEKIGTGLYIGASAIDHSCSPNAVYVTKNGKDLSVRAIEKVNKFSDVRICYINVKGDTNTRKKELKEHYFFDCKCRLCQDKDQDSLKSSISCPNQSENDEQLFEHCVPLKKGKCIKCGFRIPDETISEYLHLKTSITLDPPELDYAKWFLEAIDIFHPWDATFFEFAQKCANNIKELKKQGDEQIDEEAFRLLNQTMVTYVEKHFRQFDPIRADINFQCAMNLYESKDSTESLRLSAKFLQNAMKVREVSHGADHPHYDLMKRKFYDLIVYLKSKSE